MLWGGACAACTLAALYCLAIQSVTDLIGTGIRQRQLLSGKQRLLIFVAGGQVVAEGGRPLRRSPHQCCRPGGSASLHKGRLARQALLQGEQVQTETNAPLMQDAQPVSARMGVRGFTGCPTREQAQVGPDRQGKADTLWQGQSKGLD